MIQPARLRDGLSFAAPVLLGVAFSLFLVIGAHMSNGVDGFPLDDPWIHLTYARNLQEHHTFAYFPGESTTAGSTSPLYTLLLALGFNFTKDEKSLSYVLGIVSHALFLLTLAAWARQRLASAVWAAVAVLFIAFDARISTLSVSGMETNLLLFFIALAFYARSTGRSLLLGIALGLSVWVRPDGLILIVVFALDAALSRWVDRRGIPPRPAHGAPRAQKRSVAKDLTTTGARQNALPDRFGWIRSAMPAALPAAALVLLYFGFNLAVGQTLLPNTFAAKTVYYQQTPHLLFLRQDVAACYAGDGWLALVPFYLSAIVREGWRLFKRRPGVLRAEAGWAIGLTLAYFVLLPFSHRLFRYLVPALPALVILGLVGLKDAAGRLDKGKVFRWTSPSGLVAFVLLASAGFLQARAALQAIHDHREICRYHWTRHERTGRWLEENTPPEAVIATHDVGAIAYYSRRKIVDVVGVVLPEAVAHLHRPDYIPYLESLFQREKVTHLAVLRNWIEVTNVDVLFLADPEPELMEVFPWVPGVTHLMPEAASRLNQLAGRQISSNLSAALSSLQQSLAIDDRSARTWLLFGVAQELGRRWEEAERAYRNATELYPNFQDAQFRHALALEQLGRREEARVVMRSLLERNPRYPGAAEQYEKLGS